MTTLGSRAFKGSRKEKLPDSLTLEATVIQIGERPRISCGVMAVYQLAKYRVDRVVQGDYKKSEIIVDHLACERDVLEGLAPGDKVVVMTTRGNVIQRWNAKGIRNENDKVTTFYLGSRVHRFSRTSNTKETGKQKDVTGSRLKTFLRSNPELQKSFASRFKETFREIPADLQAELRQALPQFQFSIARMEVYLDPPAKDYDLIVVADADTQDTAGFVWARYWTLPASSSFARILEGHQARTKDDALEQVRVLAKLITYASNDQVGKAAARNGKLTVELLRGDGVFRVLTARIDKHLRFGRLSITMPNGKRPVLYL